MGAWKDDFSSAIPLPLLLPQRANTTVFNVPLSNLSASIFNEKGVNITRRRSAKAFEDKKRHVSTHAETNVLKLKL